MIENLAKASPSDTKTEGASRVKAAAAFIGRQALRVTGLDIAAQTLDRRLEKGDEAHEAVLHAAEAALLDRIAPVTSAVLRKMAAERIGPFKSIQAVADNPALTNGKVDSNLTYFTSAMPLLCDFLLRPGLVVGGGVAAAMAPGLLTGNYHYDPTIANSLFNLGIILTEAGYTSFARHVGAKLDAAMK